MPDKLRDRAAAQAAARQAATNGGDAPAPGTVVAKVDVAKELVDAVAPEIEKQLPRHIKPDAFLRVILTGLKNSKQAKALARCSRPSLWAAMLEAARYGLMPFTDEGAIVPFGETATFIPQYQGLIQIMYRTGQVASVTVNLIHENDLWDIEYGTNARFFHKPRFVDEHGKPADRGDPILAYCYVTLRDGSMTTPTFVTRDAAVEVMQTRSRSWQNAERYKKYDSAWHTDFPAMWQKTAVRQHAKFAPKSPELVELLLVEARDDLRRPDATPAPTWTPDGGDGGGIDWTQDMNGAVPGEVIHDEPAGNGADDDGGWPGGARPATTTGSPGKTGGGGGGGASPDHPGEPGATGGPGPAAAERVSRETATPGEPAAADDGEKVTPQTAGRIGRLFQEIGWKGKEYADRRLAIVGLATDLQAAPPVRLESPMGMTEAQGLTAEANLTDLIGKARQAKRDPAEVLQGLYDQLVTVAAENEARRARAGAEDARHPEGD